MLAGFSQRFDQGARYLLPFVTTLLFILAGAIVWPLPYIGAVTPALGLVAVFYWTIHRPDLLRPFGIFVLGLLHDVLAFLPMGLTAFVFVGLYQLILSQRRFFVGQSFFMLWVGFAIVLFLSTFVDWVVLSFYNHHLMTFMPVLIQALLTLALFPLPAWILIWVQRNFLPQE